MNTLILGSALFVAITLISAVVLHLNATRAQEIAHRDNRRRDVHA